jgi:hypothetical protein
MGKASRRKAERRGEQERAAAFEQAIDAYVDAEFANLDRHARADLCLVACERCGLEQIQPPSPSDTAIHLEDGTKLSPAGTCCVVCGCETATFVAHLT